MRHPHVVPYQKNKKVPKCQRRPLITWHSLSQLYKKGAEMVRTPAQQRRLELKVKRGGGGGTRRKTRRRMSGTG